MKRSAMTENNVFTPESEPTFRPSVSIPAFVLDKLSRKRLNDNKFRSQEQCHFEAEKYPQTAKKFVSLTVWVFFDKTIFVRI